jgi:hypothetical protein
VAVGGTGVDVGVGGTGVAVGAEVSPEVGVSVGTVVIVGVAATDTAVGVARGAVNWQPRPKARAMSRRPTRAGITLVEPTRKALFSLLIPLPISAYA